MNWAPVRLASSRLMVRLAPPSPALVRSALASHAPVRSAPVRSAPRRGHAVQPRAGEVSVAEPRPSLRLATAEPRAGEVRAAELVGAEWLAPAGIGAGQMETGQVDCCRSGRWGRWPSAVRAAWISGAGSGGRSGTELVTGCIHG